MHSSIYPYHGEIECPRCHKMVYGLTPEGQCYLCEAGATERSPCPVCKEPTARLSKNGKCPKCDPGGFEKPSGLTLTGIGQTKPVGRLFTKAQCSECHKIDYLDRNGRCFSCQEKYMLECPGCKKRFHTLTASGMCESCLELERKNANRKRLLDNLDKEIEARLRSIGLEEREIEATAEEIHPALVKYLNRPSKEILMMGARPTYGFTIQSKTGAGKTGYLAVFVRRWMKHNFTLWLKDHYSLDGAPMPVWASWRRTLFNLRRLMGRNHALEDLVERYINAPLLIIDDLGNEQAPKLDNAGNMVNDSDWSSKTILETILDERARMKRGIVFAVNVDHKMLSRRYGQPAVSRILELAPMVSIPDAEVTDRRLSFAGAKMQEWKNV